MKTTKKYATLWCVFRRVFFPKLSVHTCGLAVTWIDDVCWCLNGNLPDSSHERLHCRGVTELISHWLDHRDNGDEVVREIPNENIDTSTFLWHGYVENIFLGLLIFHSHPSPESPEASSWGQFEELERLHLHLNAKGVRHRGMWPGHPNGAARSVEDFGHIFVYYYIYYYTIYIIISYVTPYYTYDTLYYTHDTLYYIYTLCIYIYILFYTHTYIYILNIPCGFKQVWFSSLFGMITTESGLVPLWAVSNIFWVVSPWAKNHPTNIANWKITTFFMGKSTISTGPFSIAM